MSDNLDENFGKAEYDERTRCPCSGEPIGIALHNHFTRDIKPLGECIACDQWHHGYAITKQNRSINLLKTIINKSLLACPCNMFPCCEYPEKEPCIYCSCLDEAYEILREAE